MKRTLIFIFVIFTAFILCGLDAGCSSSKKTAFMPHYTHSDYAGAWLEVKELEGNGLTESAETKVQAILEKAKVEQNEPQIVKALLYLSKYATYKEENSQAKVVNLIKKEIEAAKSPLKNVLQSILAGIYWQHFQSNRYRLLKRTEVVGSEEEDFLTWDLNRLTQEITQLYQNSLQIPDNLKLIDIKTYSPILNEEKNSEKARPYLYDFLAHRALDYFMDDQANITKAADQFQLTNKAAFTDASTFTKTTFKNTDKLSIKFYALQVFQELTKFHIEDKDPTAFLAVTLKRLDFAKDVAVLADKDEVYVNALKQLESKYLKYPSAAQISYQIAQHHFDKDEKQFKNGKKTALAICEAAIKKHPESSGANNCRYLKERILKKNLRFSIETANTPNQAFRALVEHKNITKLYGRVIAITDSVQARRKRIKNTEKLFAYYRKLPTVHQWTVDLPKTDDYHTHKTEVKIDKLPLGKYFVMLSTNDDLQYKKEAVAWQETVITNLSFIRQRLNNQEDFYVLDRISGQSLPAVNYTLYKEEYSKLRRKYVDKKVKSGKTDEQGKFTYADVSKNYGRLKLVLENGKDKFEDFAYINRNYTHSNNERIQTFFFTDRSIYRPGQVVHFKGIIVKKSDKTNDILVNKSTVVTLKDVNYQKVADLKVTTNKYGSFSGKFTLPTGLLNGRMTINETHGSMAIQVEEYKRPKFAVKFKPVEGSYRLKEKVTVNGFAKAYAGANIDGAKVNYRVVRNASFPYWGWYFWRPQPASSEMEIAQGTMTTNEKGEFSIDFTAVPDTKIEAKDKPQYSYTVYADITDINGETQSSKTTVEVGYIALLAKINIADKVNKATAKDFDVSTKNLNGQFEAAKVDIMIHRLEKPAKIFRDKLWGQPDLFLLDKETYYKTFKYDVHSKENHPSSWKKGTVVFEQSFTTTKDSKIAPDNIATWKPGQYLVSLTTKDKFGQGVKWEKYVTIFGFEEKAMPNNDIFWHQLSHSTIEPGQKLTLAYGSAVKEAQILLTVEHDKKIIQQEWLTASENQGKIAFRVKEEYRGGFIIHLNMVKWNRSFKHTYNVNVPWTNKELTVEVVTFRDKLQPGQEEEWKIKISGAKKDKVAAELLAGMYDASLDALKPHAWNFNIHPYYGAKFYTANDKGFGISNSQLTAYKWNDNKYGIDYQKYTTLNWFGFYLGYVGHSRMDFMMMKESAGAPPPMAAKSVQRNRLSDSPEAIEEESLAVKGASNEAESNQNEGNTDFGEVQIRKNLNELAFFYPHLETDTEGNILISFKAPESLTKWKLMTFAHTKDLAYKQLTKETVTQKDLMVLPNPPRFFRENDEIHFATKISNLTDKALSGQAKLMLFDALTMKPIDKELGNKNPEQSFTAKAEQSTALSWKLTIPKDIQAVTYRIVAKAGKFSDGEENALPVLTNRMLVTESMPLPVRGKGTKEFTFENLKKAKDSKTLTHQRLTLEYTSQPAWYAIQALPYLMEYPHQCSEQIFSRYYANSIASHIANSNPKIKKVFDAWKVDEKENQGEALLSNLEKNQDLKNALLEETPWVLAAKNETERKHRLGVLFDLNRMSKELAKAEKELQKRQLASGGWSWFPGGRESRYITQHIVAGFGHLDNLGVKTVRGDAKNWTMTKEALVYLDEQMQKDYDNLLKYKTDLKGHNIGYSQIHYLYTRSYFKDVAIAKKHQKAFDYWKGQATEYWLKNSRYMQGMIALALHRFDNGDAEKAKAIMKSLKENATYNEEMGMYFKSNTGGFYWHQAPIETQALLIEAFDEIMKDTESVEAMKVWLLKQKQTQDWKTTKATVEACYALLLRGTDVLASDKLANITIGEQTLKPREMPDVKVEAGTGYFKTHWKGEDITADMGNIKVEKEDEGVSWGAVYWQYFEQLDKITPAETPLKLEKKLFKVERTKGGEKLIPIADKATLQVGDKVKVRLEIRVDRDLEYVHIKDMRAAGFEPINVISSYKWQDGLGYYESTKDAATNFFVSWLAKGTYVFEYPIRVAQKGDFSNGITTIQCMYAPEFSSHSEGIRVTVE